MRGARRRVVWSPAADRDLLDIWGYYARVASAETADNLLREIDRVGEGISENPRLSRQRDELLSGLRSVIVRPHVIFFRIGNGAVEVVRVLHGRRDFPTIFGREGQ
jgi:toxin ParE1/3/4